MPNSNVEKFINLTLWLQGRQTGVTMDRIAEYLGSTRRTAERHIARLKDMWGEGLVSESDYAGQKCWRIAIGKGYDLSGIKAEMLADLESATELLRREGRDEQAGRLEQLRGTLSAGLRQGPRLETDLEALIAAEGLAMRPGPKEAINEGILSVIRSAILSMRIINIRYRGRTSELWSWQNVEPYGFLWGTGQRHRLVAFSRNEWSQDIRTFLLGNIKEVRITEETFTPKQDFDLRAYAERSFGVYQEARLYDVVWRFSPKAAKYVVDYWFHPQQELEKQADGSVIVRFSACGLLEMAWHLFTWGDEVTILKPAKLAKLLRDLKSA